jgi:hypothetical protein
MHLGEVSTLHAATGFAIIIRVVKVVALTSLAAKHTICDVFEEFFDLLLIFRAFSITENC